MSVEVYVLLVANDVRKCGRCSCYRRCGYIVTNDDSHAGLDMLFVCNACQTSAETEFLSAPENIRSVEYHNALFDQKNRAQFEQVSAGIQVKPDSWYVVDNYQRVRRESSAQEAGDAYLMLQTGLRFERGENILMLRAAV